MPISYSPKTKWPLPGWKQAYAEYELLDAWYSGDATRLATVYAGRIFNPYESDSTFWARATYHRRRAIMHVPVAADISMTSSVWLFGEHPRVIVPGADDEKPETALVDAQVRLSKIIEEGQVWSRVSEAAEVCSALGGIVLKIDWDGKLASYPILSIAQVDSVIPEFRYGQLVACTFWKELESDGAVVWRHIERREKGFIFNALFKGTPEELGDQQDFAVRSDTAYLIGQETIQTDIDDVLCRYVPNLRPNRRFRKLTSGMNPSCVYIGQSDYSGTETVMESIDETFTSLLRDIRLGAGKLGLDADKLLTDGKGNFKFDYDEELFILLDGKPSENSGISANQFAIRTTEHLDAALAFYRQCVTNAGYSPQSFGLEVKGQAESGTALNIREGKSFKTTARKADYWKPVLQDLFRLMLVVDRKYLSGMADPVDEVVTEMQDGIKTGLQDIAPSLQQIDAAAAVSTEIKVKMLHPDWNKTQVMAEVERIHAERGVSVTDPTSVGQDGKDDQ